MGVQSVDQFKRVVSAATTLLGLFAISHCAAAEVNQNAKTKPLPQLPVSPFSAKVDIRDAERFAKVFLAADGKPSAQSLQKSYLDNAGRGVKMFTPYRIENAENLAKEVTQNHENYRYAIATCLPVVESLNTDLRAIYLAYGGLLPSRKLPEMHVVFGANNSGGGAEPGIQVIGLEVTCSKGTTAEQFRANMRNLFAHETAHTWQPKANDAIAVPDLLLFMAIREGVADYLSWVVTGEQPSPKREAWGRKQEAAVWRMFEADLKAFRARSVKNFGDDKEAQAIFQRWFNNAFSSNADRPGEAGYWVGMQIVRHYVDQQMAKGVSAERAINAVLNMQDAKKILQDSGYERYLKTVN
jgi:hypothetical protein